MDATPATGGATLTLARLRVSEMWRSNCERVDLARRELRVLDAKTPAVVRRVDIHDDLHDELAAHRAARGIRVGERVERLLQAVTLSDERPQLSRANREFGANSIKQVGYALLL